MTAKTSALAAATASARGVNEPLLDRGPVAAVAGLLLRRKLVNPERLDPPLPGGQLGVSLTPVAQLLSQAVVLRSELAA